MSEISASATASLDDEGDLGDWAGTNIDQAEDVSRKVTLAFDSPLYTKALTTGTGYYQAVSQYSPGLAAWWVYSTDDIIVTALTDESDYATRMAQSREAAHDLLVRRWMEQINGGGSGVTFLIKPMSAAEMRAAVALATGEVHAQQVQPVIGALQDYEISNEVVNFNNTGRMTTKFQPNADAVPFFVSRIISAKTRKPIPLTQNRPGVFELPEPGYGAIIVNYATRRRLISVAYEAFAGGTEGYWTDGVREQFAREVLTTGKYPEGTAPPIMLLITSTRTNAQVVARASRQVNDIGSSMAAQQLQDNADPAKQKDLTLTEQSRATITRRITSSQNPNQWVEVDIATEITMADGDGKSWKFTYNEA